MRANQIRLIRIGDDNQPATSAEIKTIEQAAKKGGTIPKTFNKMPVEESIVKTEGKGTLLVEVGSESRPAWKCDLKGVEKAIGRIIHKKSITIVTHHNLKLTWLRTTNSKIPFIVSKHMQGEK